MNRKDILGLYELSAEEIDEILTLGLNMKKLLRLITCSIGDCAPCSMILVIPLNCPLNRYVRILKLRETKERTGHLWHIMSWRALSQ